MHPYPPSVNISNVQGYYYNNGELHQQSNNNSAYTSQCQGGLMVPDEFFSLPNHSKTPQLTSNLSQNRPPLPPYPMYYIPPPNVPFINNNCDNSNINHPLPLPPTPSSCSNSTSTTATTTTATITTANTPPINSSSLPSSPQPRHNSLTSDTSISSVHPLEEETQTKNNKSPKNKREKALERNRQAALRCRQRKKEWLNQLQYNVEVLTRENRMLEQQSISLREEILNLKTILLTHRECSVSKQPGALDVEKVIYKPVL